MSTSADWDKTEGQKGLEAADETAQYFSSDANGGHVGTVAGNPNSGSNLLLDSEGVKIRNNTDVVASFTASMLSFLAAQGYLALSSTSPLGEALSGFDIYAAASRALNLYTAGEHGVRIVADSASIKDSASLILSGAASGRTAMLSVEDGVHGDTPGTGAGLYLQHSSTGGIIGLQYKTAAGTAIAGYLSDWVTAFGTSSIFAYRKYASGVSECWGTARITGITTSNNYGYDYYSSFASAATFPSGLFNATPTVFLSYGLDSNGLVTAVTPWPSNTSATNLGITVHGPAAQTDLILLLGIHAIGRWKS